MNPRERALAIFLVCVILLGGGGFFGYQFLYVPWAKRNAELGKLEKEYNDKQARKAEIEKHKAELERWKLLSLPGDTEVAGREYARFLTDLLSRDGFAAGHYSVLPQRQNNRSVPVVGAAKEPIYTRLVFGIKAEAPMDNLVRALRDFYSTGLMHQVKSLTVQRPMTMTDPARANDLTIDMTVEALVVTGSDKRTYLMPNVDRHLVVADAAAALVRQPTFLVSAASPGAGNPGVLAEPSRLYDAIAKKNVFLGRPPVVKDSASPEWIVPRFVHLSDITEVRGRTYASLYDVLTNKQHKLRAADGYNAFPLIRAGDKRTILIGEALKIDDRDMVFRTRIKADDPPADPKAARDGFFKLGKKEREELLADEVVGPDEVKDVYRVDKAYWGMLVAQLVVRMRDRDSFKVELEREKDRPVENEEEGNTVEVLRGKVVRTEGNEVLIRVEPRYYGIHLGQNLADALKNGPLPDEQVKEFTSAN